MMGSARTGGGLAGGGPGGTEASDFWPPAQAHRCMVCDRVIRPSTACEDVERLEGWLIEKAPDRLWLLSRLGPRLCKDCCITTMGGHRCVWWDLCWRG